LDELEVGNHRNEIVFAVSSVSRVRSVASQQLPCRWLFATSPIIRRDTACLPAPTEYPDAPCKAAAILTYNLIRTSWAYDGLTDNENMLSSVKPTFLCVHPAGHSACGRLQVLLLLVPQYRRCPDFYLLSLYRWHGDRMERIRNTCIHLE